MELKDNKQLINLILNHLEEEYSEKNNMIEQLSEYKDFIIETKAYRAILIPRNYEELDNEIEPVLTSSIVVGNSFSYSKEGLFYFLEGNTDRYQYEDFVSIDLFSAEVVGINLKKVILYLKENNLIDEYTSGIHNEDEIIAIEIKTINHFHSTTLHNIFDEDIIFN